MGLSSFALIESFYFAVTQDDANVVQVEDSNDNTGIPNLQADRAGPCNQPAILNNGTMNDEANVELIYDDTTEDFSQDSRFNSTSSRQLTGDVES